MTQVRIHNESGITFIDLEGHAEYSPGNDIVCAAISTMAYALINSFQRMYDVEELKDFSYTAEPGDIHIKVQRDMRYIVQYRAVMEFFMTGLGMIEEQYPEHLEIDEET